MKHRGMLWGLLSLLTLIVTIALSQPVVAAADYTINPYQVHVTVLKNGDANVTQTMTYRFDDDYHGVYNNQDLRGIKGGKLTSVATAFNGGKLTAARQSTAHTDNTYQVNYAGQNAKVKLYHGASDGDKLKVVYHYHLQGVITNYRDTAELNWRVIGSNWDVDLENVKVVIQLPATQVKQLQAWTHGSLSGYTKVDKAQGRVTMTLAENPSGSFVESHLIFPTSVTAANTNFKDENRKAAVQKQEANLAEQANTERKQKKQRTYGGFLAFIAVTVALGLGFWWWLWRHPANRYPHPIPANHFFDVPSVAPALAESLVDFKSPNTDALSGEILMAVSNHEIAMEPVKDGRHQTLKLTKLVPTVSNYFLQKCFMKVAKDDSFTLLELKKYGKRDKKGRLSKWFHTWQGQVDELAEPYQDADNIKLRQRTMLGTVGLTALISIAIGVGWTLNRTVSVATTIIGLLAMVALWVYTVRLYQHADRNNEAGLIQVNEVGGFRRMLKDIGHFNTAEVGDLILWEQILPYAAAFGLAQKVANKLAVDFSADALNDSFVVFYPIFYSTDFGGSIGSALNDSISSAIQTSTAASSSSGSSGGFSGGSSGGFGGGSGGGAF
ncbi:DUF2207 domain-containing protein [Levilactobacillus koreensis]|uniref:Membrane protein n=1 Tax=Levilactobacillus koreensis TaxID=637971 RepID=A0AAC9ER13_9LACO|nr:DUF2207 domain-containing protein [Levilactobacillus koreensis]AKP64561.1 membrane protein [Levilactobacillus koreensis]